MTIVEEIDKMSGRPHRSKNIVDALKFWWELEKTPQNIGDAVKQVREKKNDESGSSDPGSQISLEE